MLETKKTTLIKCMRAWLKSEKFNKEWMIHQDPNKDWWIVYRTKKASTNPGSQIVPHYMIDTDKIEITECCPHIERETHFKMADPTSLDKLKKSFIEDAILAKEANDVIRK